MSDGPNELGSSEDLSELAQDEFEVELDGILDDLEASDSQEDAEFSIDSFDEETDSAPESPALTVAAPPVVSPPPLKPPPIKKKASQEWRGRTRFEELFVPDAAPLPSFRGGLEEKVEFLREKLKRTETQVAKFRDAWSTRESEIDHAEALIKAGRQEVQGLSTAFEKATQTSGQLEEEIVSLNRNHAQAVVELEGRLSEQQGQYQILQEEKSQAETASQAENQTRLKEIQEFETRIAALVKQGEEDRLRHGEEIERFNEELTAKSGELDSAQLRIGDLESDSKRLGAEFQETKEAFEHDLEIRNEAIGKYKGTIETQRHSIAEKEEKLEELTNQLTRELDEAAQARLGLETQLGELNESAERDLENARIRHEQELERIQTSHEEASEKVRVAHEQEWEDARGKHEQELKNIRAGHADEVESLRASHEQESTKIQTAHADEVESLRASHEQESTNIQTAHADEVESLRASHEQESTNIQTAHAEAVESLRENHDKELEDSRISNERELDKYETKIEDLRGELSEEESKVAKLNEELIARDATIEGHEKEMAALEETLSGSQAQVTELQQEIDGVSEKIVVLEEASASAQANAEELRNSLDGAQSRLQTVEDDYAAAKNELTQFEAQLEETQGQMTENIGARDEAIDNLRSSLEQVKGEKEELGQRLEGALNQQEHEKERLEGDRKQRSERIREIADKLAQARQLLN